MSGVILLLMIKNDYVLSLDFLLPLCQNMHYIEDSCCSSPTQTDSLNNGFISGTVSPSRTPNTTDNIEEKATLLGNTGNSMDDRSVHSN